MTVGPTWDSASDEERGVAEESRLARLLREKLEAGEADAARWAERFSGECRKRCIHTAEEHSDGRRHLACVFLDQRAQLVAQRADNDALAQEVERLRGVVRTLLAAIGATRPDRERQAKEFADPEQQARARALDAAADKASSGKP